MSTVCSRGDTTCLYVKGAPDSVIARCTRVRREDGSVVPLDDALRKALVEKVHAMASRPLRCLALATKEVSDWEDVERGGPAAHESFESDLILEGVAGIRDPPRPEAKRAIERCKSAGGRVFTPSPSMVWSRPESRWGVQLWASSVALVGHRESQR